MTLYQHKDGIFVAREKRDNVTYISQGLTQDSAYYALCEKLDGLFAAKCDREAAKWT